LPTIITSCDGARPPGKVIMPTPPVDLDPNIAAFALICDRLCQVEENTELLRRHLRREHMCKPHGSLEAALLGFPSKIEIHLNPESRNPASGPSFPSDLRRPYLEASCVSVDCNGTCPGFPLLDLYRRFFPEKADDIRDHEERSGDLARCDEFGVEATEDFVADEALLQTMRLALNESKFARLIKLDEYENTCGALLVASGDRVDLSDHIRQAIAIFEARGHTGDCMKGVNITPCHRGAAIYLGAARAFAKAEPEPAQRDHFRRVHGITRAHGWLPYFQDHTFLCNYDDELKRMHNKLWL
jgi:predicted nucleic-acid-binding protein